MPGAGDNSYSTIEINENSDVKFTSNVSGMGGDAIAEIILNKENALDLLRQIKEKIVEYREKQQVRL